MPCGAEIVPADDAVPDQPVAGFGDFLLFLLGLGELAGIADGDGAGETVRQFDLAELHFNRLPQASKFGGNCFFNRKTVVHTSFRAFPMGRSTQDLIATLRGLAGWKAPVDAMNGMTFELDTPHGRMMATMLAGIAQFERDLISKFLKSELASAKGR